MPRRTCYIYQRFKTMFMFVKIGAHYYSLSIDTYELCFLIIPEDKNVTDKNYCGLWLRLKLMNGQEKR